jgi:hypothetical protein
LCHASYLLKIDNFAASERPLRARGPIRAKTHWILHQECPDVAVTTLN